MLLSYRDIAKHQAVVPWKRERQVEQDLLLCLAMQAIFTDGFLSGQVSMRGGTLLHKVHLAPAARYSEDIDLVVHGDRPEGHIEKALRRVLLPVLGKPVGFGWESVKLAIRNAVQPSRVLRLSYSVPNVSGDGPELDIVVEANVTERVSYLPVVRVPYAFEFRGERVASGEWRVASGEWRVASGEWRVASGEWRVASGEWRVAGGAYLRWRGYGVKMVIGGG
jgi:hypothetical protein